MVFPSVSSSHQNGYYGFTTSTTVWIGNYYINQTGNRGDDWAVAKLENSFDITPLSLVSFGSQSHDGMWIRTQGYPSDESEVNLDGRTLYLTTGVGYSLYNTSDYLKYGSAKAYSGMSGGPVLARDNSGQYCIVGIISGGFTSSSDICELNDTVYVAFDTNLYNTIMSKI